MTSRTAARAIHVSRQLRRTAAAVSPREDLVRAMSDMLSLKNPGSTAEALRALRLSYPDCPLTLRLAALAAAMKRPPREPNGIYLRD